MPRDTLRGLSIIYPDPDPDPPELTSLVSDNALISITGNARP